MKQYLTILFCIIILNVFSGDTTKIRVHDATDMTWYGIMMSGDYSQMDLKLTEKYIYIIQWAALLTDVQIGIIPQR